MADGPDKAARREATPAGGLRVWRLSHPDRSPDHDDRDACLSGGRWNSPGVPAYYCADALPLAVLEAWVHLAREDREGKVPERMAVCLELPAGATIEDVEDVPVTDDEAARRTGDDWAGEGRSLALRVPSAVVPAAHNIVLNPEHPDYAGLRVVSMEICPFDPRLASPDD